jgi:hypothetical protein
MIFAMIFGLHDFDMIGIDVSTLRASGGSMIPFRGLTTPAEDMPALRA